MYWVGCSVNIARNIYKKSCQLSNVKIIFSEPTEAENGWCLLYIPIIAKNFSKNFSHWFYLLIYAKVVLYYSYSVFKIKNTNKWLVYENFAT